MTDKIIKDNYVSKIGLIGLGRWGRNIVRATSKIPFLKLTCVASKNPEAKKIIQSDCKIFSDWRNLISFAELDGVVICTPPKTHFEIASRLIQARLPILIEKPLTLDIDEARTIYKLSKSHENLVMVDFTQLFNYKFIGLKESLNLIGDIKFLLTKAGNFGPYRDDAPVLWDWGSHELSILLSLMGKSPIKMSTKKLIENSRRTQDESIWEINCSFGEQVESRTLIGNMMPKTRKCGVLGAYGMLVFDDLSNDPLCLYTNWNKKEFPIQGGISIDIKKNKEPLVLVLESFSNFIKKSLNTHWSLSMGVEITRLLNNCYSNN
ncbi:Gfo/Idh/MocA family protein [Prochlorococcus marinus]|uniref:Gfo/Idh/MocA family protein n=1 Tax=Prochlorococcus marinus TaxID=1219 RepID=UPI0022B401A3|nr:Gfo/Idh/MocA family oxidoreductase [Prochlorococcus marinus]